MVCPAGHPHARRQPGPDRWTSGSISCNRAGYPRFWFGARRQIYIPPGGRWALLPCLRGWSVPGSFPAIQQGANATTVRQVFCTPGVCIASWLQPRLISRRPSVLISKHFFVSLAPPQRLTHVTAATLSPRITMGSPTDSGVSAANFSITHAITTISSSSSKLIVMIHVSRRLAFRFSSCVSPSGRSYLRYIFFSTQQPPTASKLTSNGYFVWPNALALCNRACSLLPLLQVAYGLPPTSRT